MVPLRPARGTEDPCPVEGVGREKSRLEKSFPPLQRGGVKGPGSLRYPWRVRVISSEPDQRSTSQQILGLEFL